MQISEISKSSWHHFQWGIQIGGQGHNFFEKFFSKIIYHRKYDLGYGLFLFKDEFN